MTYLEKLEDAIKFDKELLTCEEMTKLGDAIDNILYSLVCLDDFPSIHGQDWERPCRDDELATLHTCEHCWYERAD